MADESLDDGLSAMHSDRDRFRGLDRLTAEARDLADRLRETTTALGSFAEQELAFVVGLAEQIRDRTLSPELLREARAMPVVSGLRVTSHRVVDLGFDALSVTLKLGSDTVDEFLSAPHDRRAKLAAGG